MTRPLADWEDLKVQYLGVMTTRRVQERVYFLLTNVRVRPWSLPVEQARTVDHLWIDFEDSDKSSYLNATKDSYPLLENYNGCGVIHRYKRGNGSWDYGIKAYCGLVRDCSISVTVQAENPSEALAKLDQLEFLALQGKLLAPFGVDLNETFAEIDDLRKFCQRHLELEKRQAELEKKYELIRHKSSRGKPQLNVIQLPGERKKTVVGFGGSK